MSYLSPEVVAAAQAHAKAEYPKESCGFVLDGRYQAVVNIHPDPENFFEIAPQVVARFMTDHWGQVEAILHSHPNGPLFPSEADMRGQIETGKVWGIIALDADRVGEPLLWGDALPVPALIGRQFMHGVTDCYALIRDTYRLGRVELAKVGIDWPHDPIVLPEVPRDDEWWSSASDLYTENFEKFGFSEVKDPLAGDTFLMKIRSEKYTHGGVLLGNELILHHLPKRLSRREPASNWLRARPLWIRYHA